MNYGEKEQLFADALDLTNLETTEACLLTIVQRCYRAERGLDTPSEKFVCSHLGLFLLRAPDFDDVQREVEELRLDWDDAVDTAKRFYTDYRELVISEKEPAAQEKAGGPADL